jgi:hypothetical protein
MPVDDRTRLNLLRRLEAVLGPEEANTLMAHLPPVTWNEVATKDDLGTLGTTLRGEMHAMEIALRSDMKAMETSLRSEMHVGFAELRTEMANVRTEMANFRTDITDAMSRQLKWMVTFAAAWSSLLIAAVRLVP